MARQYNIDGLSFEVDLRFLVHSLVVETDEDGHIYYDEKKHQIRQKLIENHGFTFIIIIPDVEKFDLDVEIATIYNHIKKSFVKLAVNSAEKSLKEKFAQKLFSYISNISKPLKQIMHFIH